MEESTHIRTRDGVFSSFFLTFSPKKVFESLPHTFLGAIAEIFLTAGEAEAGEDESGRQSPEVAVCVPHTGRVSRV